jgi:hypothetical protein
MAAKREIKRERDKKKCLSMAHVQIEGMGHAKGRIRRDAFITSKRIFDT